MLGVECEGLRLVRRPRVRVVAALAKRADPGPVAPEAVVMERFGYVPSAKWPRGVISRGRVRLKPA